MMPKEQTEPTEPREATTKSRVDPSKLHRRQTVPGPSAIPEPPAPVSAGAVEKALDLAFNPSREKIREVTIVDRMQGRMFPLLDIINAGQQYCLEIALFRQDPEEYEYLFKKARPIMPNLLDDLLYRTAQWQKSVQGVNLTKITDIALAETETRAGEEGEGYGGDRWGNE